MENRYAEKYALTQFNAAGRDSEAAGILCRQLVEDVYQDLHETILHKVNSIVAQLNAVGHNLQPFRSITPGEYEYRSHEAENWGGECNLRLSVDIVVTSGFAHLFR